MSWPTDEYLAHLRSSYWADLRREVFERAGGRCEREVESRYDPPSGCYEFERCGSTDGLQLHHLHYNTLGRESLKDVLLLCNRCHVVTHVMQVTCLRCSGSLLDGESEADELIDDWDEYREFYCLPLKEAVAERYGPLCSYCAQVTGN